MAQVGWVGIQAQFQEGLLLQGTPCIAVGQGGWDCRTRTGQGLTSTMEAGAVGVQIQIMTRAPLRRREAWAGVAMVVLP